MEFKKWFAILLILFISLFLAEFLISFTGRFIFSTKAVQDTVSVSVDVVDDGAGGGGGGGGPSGGPSEGGKIITQTPQAPIDYDFSQEDSMIVVVSVGSIKIFSFDGEVRHLIEVKEVNDDNVILTFRSSYDQIVTLNVGEFKEIDLDNKNGNDIRIALDRIDSG
ncbi:MAG: hypothetical protein AABX90_00990, partial [Nanoarchaeota archaeon]